MGNTVLVELNNNALNLLYDLEKKSILRVVKNDISIPKIKLSDKLRGLLSKEEGEDLRKHVQQIREEWGSTL